GGPCPHRPAPDGSAAGRDRQHRPCRADRHLPTALSRRHSAAAFSARPHPYRLPEAAPPGGLTSFKERLFPMPMDPTEIERLIKAKFPDARIEIRDLAGD